MLKIIAIEGLDKSGKKTQTDLLVDWLNELGCKSIKSEFHRYDTKTGALIMDWLTHKWEASQLAVELVMAADKINQQRWFDNLENEGYEFLILDRYLLSQFVYGKSTGGDLDWIKNIHKFTRKPDLDIVIDIPAEVSMTRKGKHNGGNNDRYESDLQLLTKVRENYKTLALDYSAPKRALVDGTKSIEEIRKDIIIKILNEYNLLAVNNPE